MIATVSVVHDFSSDGVITAQHCHSCADSALSQRKLILDHRLPGYVGLARELLRRFLGEQLSLGSVQSGRPGRRTPRYPIRGDAPWTRGSSSPPWALAEGPNCARWCRVRQSCRRSARAGSDLPCVLASSVFTSAHRKL